MTNIATTENTSLNLHSMVPRTDRQIVTASPVPTPDDQATNLTAGPFTVINQQQTLYRPVKEELTLSLARALGRALAFPFQLIADMIRAIALGIIGIARSAALIVLTPTLLMLGCEYAEKNQKREAGEIAQDVGSGAIEIAGQVMTGAYDEMTGKQPKDSTGER